MQRCQIALHAHSFYRSFNFTSRRSIPNIQNALGDDFVSSSLDTYTKGRKQEDDYDNNNTNHDNNNNDKNWAKAVGERELRKEREGERKKESNESTLNQQFSCLLFA